MFTHNSGEYTNQSGNNVDGGGSIVARDQINHFHGKKNVSEELLGLYDRLKTDGVGERSAEFCEKLNHYMAQQTDGDVRGLDSKLAESSRSDMLIMAKMMKEQATKAIMRQQTSKTAQRIYVIIIERIYFDFIMKVTPLIQDDKPRIEVDERISDIINGIYEVLGENLLEFTEMDLLGLLFFLGGNCHIRWDKC
ncbi:TPA: hypothetical protein PXN84_003223 [Yersinia enterocolitica]|nr:hypothetical protein [Yersinia enterocolitica]HDL7433315.1 hypothetical protein [Yersinia enterocolitica]HDL7475724.1 hypothetical protein [Yersinia enterocolitica]